MIEQEAQKGSTIEVEAIRKEIESDKAAYKGPNRDVYCKDMDNLLASIAAKYGSRIPIDEAHNLMQRLDPHRCAACGAQLKEDSDFCSQCGNRVRFDI